MVIIVTLDSIRKSAGYTSRQKTRLQRDPEHNSPGEAPGLKPQAALRERKNSPMRSSALRLFSAELA